MRTILRIAVCWVAFVAALVLSGVIGGLLHLLDPITDGAVLPLLHLNGYKISNPTVLARMEHEELEQFLRGCGWTPYFVEGARTGPLCTRPMATTIETRVIEDIRNIQSNAAEPQRYDAAAMAHDRPLSRPRVGRAPRWSMASRSKERSGRIRSRILVDPGHPQNTSRSSRVWMKSYRPEELFDEKRSPFSKQN